MALEKILGRALRMIHTGKDGLCTSSSRMIRNSQWLFPLFKTPEQGPKGLDGNAWCTQRSTAGAGAALSALRGNHYLLTVDYYGNFPNSIKQHGSQQYSKSGCDRALRAPGLWGERCTMQETSIFNTFSRLCIPFSLYRLLAARYFSLICQSSFS